ncbi:hypothetical protein MMC13_006811 [Lambiella insularis]|nr:hypothetical protein [Lambiella insularis]
MSGVIRLEVPKLPEDDDSSSSEEESSADDPVESLVAGRAKRATAGNRLTSLLQKEGDDELELLFAEDEEEEDVEFEEAAAEDASDVRLDSSSDDDDQGPAANPDDLEGERELERQAKAERRKKRKGQELFKRPPPSRTKVKVDPATTSASPTTPANPPKKKSERVSWLPTADEGSVRASSRKQTMQNKEIVHQRMLESEKRRHRQIKTMEAAAKRKEASKAKVMTQADRMAEAARIEKRNEKSLNRWEETEKKRIEEQKARLAALHNRQLQGPVISWWSGPSKWVNGRLIAVGAKQVVEESTSTAKLYEAMNDPPPSGLAPNAQISIQEDTDTRVTDAAPLPPLQEADSGPPPGHAVMPPPDPHALAAPVQAAPSFLDGIHYYAALSQQPTSVVGPVPSDDLPSTNLSAPTLSHAVPEIELHTRNLVSLRNVDGNASRASELQNHTLFRKRNPKLQKALHESCAITGQPAKFRDPKTGLPYASSYAYKEIQKLCNGGSRWSSLLGCYVGPIASAARGAPDPFYRKA